MATTVYGKPNCVYCDRAKRLLNGLNIDFDYKDVSQPELREELLELVPSAKTVPQIWLYDSYIGGYDALVTFLEKLFTNIDFDYKDISYIGGYDALVTSLETAKKNQEATDWESGNYGQGRI